MRGEHIYVQISATPKVSERSMEFSLCVTFSCLVFCCKFYVLWSFQALVFLSVVFWIQGMICVLPKTPLPCHSLETLSGCKSVPYLSLILQDFCLISHSPYLMLLPNIGSHILCDLSVVSASRLNWVSVTANTLIIIGE